MLPFDRLIRALDAWDGLSGQGEVLAQIGAGKYEPRAMQWVRSLTPSEFNLKMAAADLIVAHAGMGSIISAMELSKPIVILPRRAADREVTTDHQIHSANWLREKPGVFVAMTEQELPEALSNALKSRRGGAQTIPCSAPPEFIARIRQFLVG